MLINQDRVAVWIGNGKAGGSMVIRNRLMGDFYALRLQLLTRH